ncbi:MAG: DUF2236 domain-containing protein [Chloroflexi bacterium]|nr:DUF2236 domain-containing protein [Chloroflexota bacterium]
MNVPTDYQDGYERARRVDAELAERYVAHTRVADPEADALMEELSTLEPEQAHRFLQAGMDQETEVLRDAPPLVQSFFQGLETPPPWVDLDSFGPGIRVFHRHSNLVLAGMLAGVLVEGFSTNISKSFFITGRLRDQGVRRLQQNNRHMIELFFPGGLEREGDGWKLSVRIRFVHAQVRRLLANSEDWDEEAWGVPLSAAHVGFAITAFSGRLLRHMRRLGASFSREERASFMQIWRYSGHLMGIPETILYRTEQDARELFRVGLLCEPVPGMEAAALANSLVNSAPLVAGVTAPEERGELSAYVYHVSRALIGNEMAGQLLYPPKPRFVTSLGVLAWFRWKQRYDTLVQRLFPGHSRGDAFTTLFDISNYDEEGIGYRLPTHVYAERSERW